MKQFIRSELGNYNHYQTEHDTLVGHVVVCADSDSKRKAEVLHAKIIMIEAWIKLLSPDEAFVVRRHLIEGQVWEGILYEYSVSWNHIRTRTKRTLMRYQESALQKIECFLREHEKEIQDVFEGTS